MLMREFIGYLQNPADYRNRTYSEDEIRKMVEERVDYSHATELQDLFVNEKAIHDPDREVKELQERMKEKGARDGFIHEMSTILQYFEFDCHIPLQDAMHDAIRNMDLHPDIPSERGKISSIEYWYGIEIA